MIGLLLFINFIIMQNAYTQERNDKVYKIVRDFAPTLQQTDAPSKMLLNHAEDTTKGDILSVLHDIGSLKEIVDSENKITEKEKVNGITKELEDKYGRTKKLAWLEDLLDSPKDIKVKEIAAEKDKNVNSEIVFRDILLKLIKVLEDLNKNIVDFNAGDKGNGFMMMKLPLKNHRSRPKRDIDSNSTNEDMNMVGNENKTILTNNTNNNIHTNSTDESGIKKNARRNMDLETTLEVKEKLLAYLNESFSEINIKVRPLNDLKMAFGNNKDYKIGYVIANIDALKMNLGKLENDMEINQKYWDDRTILEVFDKLKVSNNVITSLLGTLRGFVKN